MGRDQGHRRLLLDAAHKLVLEKGLSGTRVDEVCAIAGVTKGSFYHHFDSKDQMAQVLLEDFFQTLAGKLASGGWVELDDPVDRVLGFLDRAIEVGRTPFLRKGCIMGSLTVDMAEVDPNLRKEIGSRFNAVIELIMPHIEAALVSRGVSESDAASKSCVLAKQFIAVTEGAIILGKATHRRDELPEALTCFRDMVMEIL